MKNNHLEAGAQAWRHAATEEEEPIEISQIDALQSIAISLQRIADRLERINNTMADMAATLEADLPR